MYPASRFHLLAPPVGRRPACRAKAKPEPEPEQRMQKPILSQIALRGAGPWKAARRRLALALLTIALSCLLAGRWPRPALASPPLDYFVYTSQLATAKPGTQDVASILPNLKSIYTPSESNGAGPAPAGEPADEHGRLVADMSARVMGLVANSSHQHDNDMVDLEAARFAWNLMEKQALVYMENRVGTLRPFLQELLAEAQVSRPCNVSINLWLNELAGLKHWATLMWNSWGQFPMAGVFEGSYTDLGSYRGCMAIEDNELIGEPQYCTLDFQPIVPSRPRFHSIFKRVLGYDSRQHQLTAGDFQGAPNEPAGSKLTAHGVGSARFNELYRNQAPYRHAPPQLAHEERLLLASLANERGQQQGADSSSLSEAQSGNRYSKRTILQPAHLQGGPLNETRPKWSLKTEALIELALKAQYFYYVKFRIGACLPSRCSTSDVRKLTRTGEFGRSSQSGLARERNSQLAPDRGKHGSLDSPLTPRPFAKCLPRAASQRAILQSAQVNCMKKEPLSLNTHQLVAM